jgi:hypothetical protein
MRQSIADTSADAYSTGWNRWCDFAAAYKVSPFPLSETKPYSDFVGFSPAILFAQGFSAYCFYKLNLAPSTICGYLTGAAYNLKIRGWDASFLADPTMTMTRAGLRRLEVHRATKSKGTLPYTLDMVLRFKSWLKFSRVSVREIGEYTAQATAFTNLLRRSEYIPTKADHYLRSMDVWYITDVGQIVFSHDLNQLLKSSIVSVVIHVRSSKTDKSGLGFKFVYHRGTTNGTNSIDICEVLLDWSLIARSQKDDPFFSARNEEAKLVWSINDRQFTATIRLVAASFGFKKEQVKLFKIHSLRYGGASTLSAAGLEDSAIKIVGRWKSLTFMQYIKAARGIFERTQKALADPSFLSGEHVKLFV